MTYHRPRLRPTITRRQSTAAVAFMSLGTDAEIPMPQYRKPVKRGKQPESASNDAVKQWARIRGGVLYRNVRGQAGRLPPEMIVGLGPNGYGDNIGYLTITITPDMVGRKVAVFSLFECKRADKALLDPAEYGAQFKYVEEVRAAGGIAGFARQADDAEMVLQAWRAGR